MYGEDEAKICTTTDLRQIKMHLNDEGIVNDEVKICTTTDLRQIKMHLNDEGIVNDANKLAYIQEGTYTTIVVSFINDTKRRKYTYKLHNSMKEVAQVGHMAIVNTDTGYKLVDIIKVHETSELDYTAAYAWKWVVSIVDDSWYIEHSEKERKALYEMSQAEARAKLEQSLGADAEVIKSKWGF